MVLKYRCAMARCSRMSRRSIIPREPLVGWAHSLTLGFLGSALLFLGSMVCGHTESAAGQERWWPDSVESSLAQSGTNRAELVMALRDVSAAHRPGLQFLVENMPARDLSTLSAAFLLEHITLAYSALEEAPWRRDIPRELFLNDVLPYASVTERREPWRKALLRSAGL